MIHRHMIYDIPWIDIENPTADDIHAIIEEFDIDETSAIELTRPSLRSKVDRQRDYLFLVLHFPDHPAHNVSGTIEIDFLVHRDFLITVRYATVDILMVFEKVHHMNNLSKVKKIHGGIIFSMMLTDLYHGLTEEMSLIKKDIDRVESQIFSDIDKHISKSLLRIHRKLLDCRSALRFHSEVLASFEKPATEIFGDEYAYEIRLINNMYLRMSTMLETYRDVTHELRETYDALLTHTTNEVMKTLTLMSFITFPLALLVAVIAFPGAPDGWHTEHGFWILITTITTIAASMLLFFKKKNWL